MRGPTIATDVVRCSSKILIRFAWRGLITNRPSLADVYIPEVSSGPVVSNSQAVAGSPPVPIIGAVLREGTILIHVRC